MKKTISINKLNKKDRDAIISVDSRIVSVTLEVEMASKAPAWFVEFRKEINVRFDRLESKVDENSKNIKRILECPTIQKEIKKA